MGLLHGVILYASTFIVLMGMGLIWDVWRHKDSFEIAARSPMLLCLAGAAHVALVFLQMTAGISDSSFPCTITIWASYISFGTISAGYLLRAARLVVVYDRELRRKYHRLVKPSVQRKCMAATLVPCCLVALIIQLVSAGARKRSGTCLFFMESWTFFLPLTLLYLAAMAAMASKLKNTNDAFKIKHEIFYVIVATAITSAARTVHIALVRASWSGDDDMALSPTVHDLMSCAAALYVSFYRPLKAFYGVGSRRSLRGIHSARRIYSGEDSYDRRYEGNNNNRQSDKGEGRGGVDQDNPETWGVLKILRNSTLRGLFVNFCEQSLCGESVDFLVDVAIHYEHLTDPEEQFASLSDIVENYLAQGSANEVNVSNAYRNAAGAWLTKKDEFFALEGELRAHVLDRQRDEIAKMLGENLLAKFKQTPLAIAAMRALKEVAAADNAGEEGDKDEDEDMRVMLQASAALEVARIQRMTRVVGDNTGSSGGIGGANPRLGSTDAVQAVSYYSDEDETFVSYTLETGYA